MSICLDKFLWQNCTNCSLFWSFWISLSLLFLFTRWMINIKYFMWDIVAALSEKAKTSLRKPQSVLDIGPTIWACSSAWATCLVLNMLNLGKNLPFFEDEGGSWKQEPQQPMLYFPVWIHRSATSCITVISDSEKFSSVLPPDFYEYGFKTSKTPFFPQKGP